MKYISRVDITLRTGTPFSRSLSHDLPLFFFKDIIPDWPHSSQVPGKRSVGNIQGNSPNLLKL